MRAADLCGDDDMYFLPTVRTGNSVGGHRPWSGSVNEDRGMPARRSQPLLESISSSQLSGEKTTKILLPLVPVLSRLLPALTTTTSPGTAVITSGSAPSG